MLVLGRIAEDPSNSSQEKPAGPGTAANVGAQATGQMPPHESPHTGLVAKPATRTVIARVSPTADNLGVPYYLVNIAAKPYPAFQKNARSSGKRAGLSKFSAGRKPLCKCDTPSDPRRLAEAPGGA